MLPSARVNGLITSELPVEQWHQYLSDLALANAILDRLVHSAYRVNLKGESIRKLTAKNKKPRKRKSKNTKTEGQNRCSDLTRTDENRNSVNPPPLLSRRNCGVRRLPLERMFRGLGVNQTPEDCKTEQT